VPKLIFLFIVKLLGIEIWFFKQ